MATPRRSQSQNDQFNSSGSSISPPRPDLDEKVEKKPKLRVAAVHGGAAVIAVNAFKNKSLSSWSYNIATGCVHGCTFCYVPNVATNKQQTKLEEHEGLIPPKWIEERRRTSDKINWADLHWGKYLLLRPWDPGRFLGTLKRAVKLAKTYGEIDGIKREGNKAIMFCTTTDPYQTFTIPGDSNKSELLRGSRAGLVRNALRIILTGTGVDKKVAEQELEKCKGLKEQERERYLDDPDHWPEPKKKIPDKDKLNVRILTRSPLASRHFKIYKKFGNRLLFGMSLPTLDEDLHKVYEPGSPGPKQKLDTLRAAKEAGLNIYVAMAPTMPEQSEEDLRATMQAIAALKPYTIFHEAINIRADIVDRIKENALKNGKKDHSEIFLSRDTWREYAFNRYAQIDRIAQELGFPDGVLHQWPDPDLKSKAGFMRMKRMINERSFGNARLSSTQKEEAESEWEAIEKWIQYWHNDEERISAWPGIQPSPWE